MISEPQFVRQPRLETGMWLAVPAPGTTAGQRSVSG
jgi:hypothetical protein